MNRVYFARGCRGGIVRRVQVGLSAKGYYTGQLDGQYGGGTGRAVAALQKDSGLPETGTVDASTWEAATMSPVPAVAERCLQVTAAFEGHGFSIVVGNFDGAWLTWGIIGFTLKHGQVQRLILEAWQKDPGTVTAAFGPRATELIGLLSRNDPAELKAWADSISLGSSKQQLAEP